MTKNNNDTNVDGQHIPILLKESLDLLQLQKGQVVVDCTLNRAGHAREFLKAIGQEGKLIGIDLDKEAILEAKDNLSLISNNYVLMNDNFANLEQILSSLEILSVDVIYADLGLSSQELDISGRGFSFLKNEPLLMTFKSVIEEEDLTAEYIVNNWGEDTLADIIYNFADEKYSRRIAKSIVEARKIKEIKTTFDLIEIIKGSVPIYYQKGHQEGRSHFATKTFQALRMATNQEISNIITLLETSKKVLKSGGRLGVITFHSTEDRMVKKTAKDLELIPINKKVIIPGEEEIKKNPRSRSAKLRVYTI
ncbi:MAG: rRNA (cytosine1402-N4)-methyltransferase [Patescibacteria group bacterium]|nr:rRNA (cytosine1402-N4)-methyltransferase [Patescibacteria group bacterium]